MKSQIRAIKAELLKTKHSKIIWVTFIAFAIAPLMGGVFLIMAANPDFIDQSSALSAKAKMFSFKSDWNSMFLILSQAIGIGGIMVFGFVASWLFGREYSDGTAKDLLALPVSRLKILNAKFVVYFFWSFTIAISNLVIGAIIGFALDLPQADSTLLLINLDIYLKTTLLTILIGTPIAFFALSGKGYLAPLGFVALTLVFAQVIAATGHGNYFPWSIPGIFSGAAGELKAQLNTVSYIVLISTSVVGYLATLAWWRYADQHK